MSNRHQSKCLLQPGDWSVDRKAEITSPEFHYMLSDYWGSVYLMGTDGKCQWFPEFQELPDWYDIEMWLNATEDDMAEEYGMDAQGLTKHALIQLQVEWGKQIRKK